MAESDKGKRVESSREMASTNTSFFPRDLLQSFIPASSEPDDDDEDDDEDDEDKIELNLGLSLGGRFGIDKTGTGLNKLTRSSSVVGTMPICREEKPTAATAGNTEKEAVTTEGCPSSAARSTGLTRTTSLPVETEEEWRKRKEMQTLRRMAAKRRRNEKLRSSKNQEDSGSGRGRATAAASSLFLVTHRK
ncbi:PREDICTED: ninja-family protein AFP1-like [Tarenaya hassleriana]|uniref:ninja-family protein AFP1-like n=1 Tax=Tarenaya hassleriana TaxID=28532 RepID=UPI00053C48CF|nr:PREDICTED: ninja-family protein AFP1-like [Tarenaya hassleriana]